MRPIPINAARMIGKNFGYDQVIIIARKIGMDGVEHCTTWGVDEANCSVAARIGDFLKLQVMGWLSEQIYGPRRAHKTMTPGEYAAMPIVGWHEVCRNIDGFGGTGIRLLGEIALKTAK